MTWEKYHVLDQGKVSEKFKVGPTRYYSFLFSVTFLICFLKNLYYADDMRLLSGQVLRCDLMILDGLKGNTSKLKVLNLTGHHTLSFCISGQSIEDICQFFGLDNVVC